MKRLLIYNWWLYLGLFVLSLPISAWALRQNNLSMLTLRDEVVAIDQQTGDINQIEPKLTELRDYIFSHMNASLPAPLELPGSFNVAVDQARAKAEASGQINAPIYTKAQDECERLSVPLSVRAECIQNYVLTNSPPGQVVESIDVPPKEQFVYSYISPSWSLDLAGLTTLISALLFTLFVVKFLAQIAYPKLTQKIQSDPLE